MHHWTDQKLHVHVLTCVLGYLLARLLHIRARQSSAYPHDTERLLEDLETIRRVTVIRPSHKGRYRVSTQLEDVPDNLEGLLERLGYQQVTLYIRTPPLKRPHINLLADPTTLGR